MLALLARGAGRPRAAVTVLIIPALGVLLTALVGVFALDVPIRVWSARTAAELASRIAADTGLVRAVTEMNRKLKAGSRDCNTLPHVTGGQLPYCRASFSYLVTADGDNRYLVGSVGKSGIFRRTMNASLCLKNILAYAIYAKTKILLDNEAMVDASGGGVATDPGGESVIIGNGAVLRGAAKSESWELPALVPPDEERFNLTRGGINLSTVLRPSDSGRYDFIYLTGGKRLRITGCDRDNPSVVLYVAGDVVMQQSTNLEIDAGSSLVLYAGGNIVVRNACQAGSGANDPTKCLIVASGRGKSIWFDRGARFCGIIYAPYATVCLTNSAEATGAIVADYVSILNGSKLYYNPAVMNANSLDFGLKFVVDHWWQGRDW